jgi:hypothetical protein
VSQDIINQIVFNKDFTEIFKFLDNISNYHEFTVNFGATAEMERDNVVVSTGSFLSSVFFKFLMFSLFEYCLKILSMGTFMIYYFNRLMNC